MAKKAEFGRVYKPKQEVRGILRCTGSWIFDFGFNLSKSFNHRKMVKSPMRVPRGSRERDKEKEKERTREKEKEREKERKRERERKKERERKRERERERKKERKRERERVSERESSFFFGYVRSSGTRVGDLTIFLWLKLLLKLKPKSKIQLPVHLREGFSFNKRYCAFL